MTRSGHPEVPLHPTTPLLGKAQAPPATAMGPASSATSGDVAGAVLASLSWKPAASAFSRLPPGKALCGQTDVRALPSRPTGSPAGRAASSGAQRPELRVSQQPARARARPAAHSTPPRGGRRPVLAARTRWAVFRSQAQFRFSGGPVDFSSPVLQRRNKRVASEGVSGSLQISVAKALHCFRATRQGISVALSFCGWRSCRTEMGRPTHVRLRE